MSEIISSIHCHTPPVIKDFSWFPHEDRIFSDDTASRATVINVIKGQYSGAIFISMRVTR